MNILALLVYLLVTSATVTLFYRVAARRSRPIYGKGDQRLESKSLFRLAVKISAPIGALLSLIQSFAITGLDLLGLSTVALTTAVAFLLVVFAYTDHRYRKADRTLLHWAIGLALVLGIPRLIEMQSEPAAVLFVFGALISFSLMFVPGLGPSDARAFVLIVTAGIPTLGLVPTYQVLISGVGIWLIYGIVASIRARSTKASIPLVPYILLPFVVVSLWLSLSYGVPQIINMLS